MKLTGKCLKEFEKWYSQSNNRLQYKTKEFSGDGLGFTDLPESMQYGVYVDYFGSVGIKTFVTTSSTLSNGFIYGIVYNKENFRSAPCNTRHEARAKAIEKANELRNEQL